MDDQEFYLAEILALCARKGKLVLLVSLILGVFLGGVQACLWMGSTTRAEEEEQRYQSELLEYEKQTVEFNRTIESNKTTLMEKEDYLSSSLLMKLNPYNYYVTSIYFGFTDIDTAAWDRVQFSATSVEFIYAMLRGQYLAVWNSMELPADLNISGYEGVQDKYMREILSLSSQDGWTLCISALAGSAEESERLASALYAALVKQQSTVARNFFGHKLSLLKRATNAKIDTDLEVLQRETRNAVKDSQLAIDEAAAELEKLKEPEHADGVVKSTVKYAILGLAIGFFAACFTVILWGIVTKVLLSSHQAERNFGITCLGVMKKKKPFEHWADRLCGERDWKNMDQAAAYAVRKLETQLAPEADILLASTMCEEKHGGHGGAVKALEKELNARGYTVSCVYDALHDPTFVDALKACDAMILLEKPGINKMPNEVDALALAKTVGKTVEGFVLV